MQLTALKSPAFRASFLFWVSTMIANVVNWLYNVVAGRTMSREDFAVLTVFLTVYTLVVVPANALATTVSRYIALYTGRDDRKQHHAFFQHYAGLSLTLGLTALCIFGAFSEQIQNYFGLDTITYVLLFSPSLLLLFLVAFQRGVLKGNLAFGSVGLLLITEAITKLAALILSPVMGWPLLTAAIISLPVSVLLSWLLSIALTKIHHPTTFKLLSKPSQAFMETYAFFGNSFSASVGMALLNSVSILMVKHYFSAAEAGIYAVLVLFGKILFFGAGGIIEISLPLIVRERAKGQSGRRQFLILLSLVSLVAGAIYSVYLLFPVKVILFFIGEKGLVTLPYLSTYTFGIFALIIMSCVSAYNVAKKNFGPARLVLATAVLQGALIYVYHQTLWQIVLISTGTLTGLALLTILIEFWQVFRTQSSQPSNGSIWAILAASLPFTKRGGTTLPPKLPNRLHGCELQKTFVIPGLKKAHAIGLYCDHRGRKYVAKVWNGTAHNADAMSLISELKTTQLLNAVAQRLAPQVPEKLKQVRIPEVVFSQVTPKRVVVMTEFANGTLLRELSPTKKKAAFEASLGYIAFLSNHLTPEERATLPKRSGSEYIVLFPALWMVAFLRQPKLLWDLVKAAGQFLLAVPELLSPKELGLVHRDLHTHNLLVSDSQITILDWQRAVLSYPEYEFATTLPIEFNDTLLFEYLVKLLDRKHGHESKRFIRALLVNHAVHGLTANNLPDLNITRYKGMLRFALSL